MSVTADKLWAKMQKLVDESTEKYREELDTKVHVVDVSYSALKYSDPDLTVEEYEKILLAFEKGGFRPTDSLDIAMDRIRSKATKFGYAALVKDPRYGNYLVGINYDSIQKRVSSILKELDFTTSLTGTDSKGKTTVNIGHMPALGIRSAVSPLSKKIVSVMAKVDLSAIPAANRFIHDLYTTHIEAEYNFNRPDFDLKGFNKILGAATVLVTIHSAEKNNQFSILEKRIGDRLKKYVESEEFYNTLLEVSGSNNIIEDIESAVINALGGKVNGTKHSKKTPTVNKKSIDATKNIGASKLVLRNKQTNRMIGLPRLLAFINSHLHDVVAANMGSGSSKNILNYRTGRFATSTQAKNLSMDRNGAITVFYDYMKNPYATFSEGGNQQYPRTRDPKRLIGKSIREIAAELVSNNIKTQLV